MRRLVVPIAALLAACAGDITWTAVYDFADDELEPGGGQSYVRCADGTTWSGGRAVLRRDGWGSWSKVDVCGEHATTSDGRKRRVSLACAEDGTLFALCGDHPNGGQVLVAWDRDRQGTVVPLPMEGQAILAPLPAGAVVVTEAALHVVEGTALRRLTEHTFGTPSVGAGNAADDVVVQFGLKGTHRFVEGRVEQIPSEPNELLVPVLRRKRLFVRTTIQNGEGNIFLVEPGKPPEDVRERQPDNERPVVPIDVLEDGTVVYVAYFRSGFEFENHGGHLWLGRPGAGDHEYLGGVPIMTSGSLYSPESGRFGFAVDDRTFLVEANRKLFEGRR